MISKFYSENSIFGGNVKLLNIKIKNNTSNHFFLRIKMLNSFIFLDVCFLQQVIIFCWFTKNISSLKKFLFCFSFYKNKYQSNRKIYHIEYIVFVNDYSASFGIALSRALTAVPAHALCGIIIRGMWNQSKGYAIFSDSSDLL